VLYSGTSGGNTSNDINNGTLNYPCVPDLLSAHSITFKNYNFHCPSNYSILAMFKKWATGGRNNELNQSKSQFFRASGAPFPPRDVNPAISGLTQCFTFG
jgi:hypothetical protein